MKLIAMIKKQLFGDVDKDFYIENRDVLRDTNYQLLHKACIFSMAMCAFLFFLTFESEVISELGTFYLLFTLFFVVETLIVCTYVKKHKQFVSLFYYIFAIAILYLSADIGTLKSQNDFAVTFYVFLIIIPMLRVGKPIYSVILSVIACGCFCFLTITIKNQIPFLVANDVLNAVCCCIVGIGVSTTIINLQINNIRTKVTLETISAIDELTTLANRRSLNIFVDKLFCDGSDNVSVIMADVDNFKGFNDVYGHLMGDQCLHTIGLALQEFGDKNSLFVARFGGEEFVAVSTIHQANELEAICEETLREIENLNIKNSASPLGKVTISIGYATQETTNAKTYMELIDHADDAMYRSKRDGKNRATRYDSELFR
ncbi:MAG: GGDEF domain-containing protein [Anaerovoracaceae bacterium]